jgi:hypothetical protein
MRDLALAVSLFALLAAGSTSAEARVVPGGDLTTLTKGHYTCELPGNASDLDSFGGLHQPDSDFDIIGDSSYRSNGSRGTYLMIGDKVRFTSGALQGRQFHHVGATFLRKIEADGSDGLLRCVSSTQGIAIAPGDNRRCKQRAKADLALGKRDDDLAC